MKEYIISNITNNPVNISCYKWVDGFNPKTTALLSYNDDIGLDLIMTCYETNPLSRYTNYGDPVYTDSCMEFFMSLDTDCLPENRRYVNFEMNSKGALLSEFGMVGKRTPISEFTTPPIPHTEITEEYWSVHINISNDLLHDLFGKKLHKGQAFYGNFYKCGDETKIPHFGMWNEIENPTPKFHLPQYFGKIIIKQ